jgi:hypothetical protein
MWTLGRVAKKSHAKILRIFSLLSNLGRVDREFRTGEREPVSRTKKGHFCKTLLAR